MKSQTKLLRMLLFLFFCIGSLCTTFGQSKNNIYGVSPGGGIDNIGAIFHIDPNSGIQTVDYSLRYNRGQNPYGNITYGGNGKFYGMTSRGGSMDIGVIFEWDPASNTYTKKMDFDRNNGSSPTGSFYLHNNKLYGRTSNLIFEWDPATDTYTKKINLLEYNIGQGPSEFTIKDGKFYAVTTASGGVYGHGTIFEWDPATNTCTKKIDFGNDNGSFPTGAMSLYNGKFYGMTTAGGSNNLGVIYEWDPETNNYLVKLNQESRYTEGSLTLYNGKFYGQHPDYYGDNGGIFEWDPESNVLTDLINLDLVEQGRSPAMTLTLKDGKLYGETREGGAYGYGTIFEFDPAARIFTKKVDLEWLKGAHFNDRSSPYCSLTLYNGIFYGLTIRGGQNGNGVIFTWDPESNTFSKKSDFGPTNAGFRPVGSLTLNGGRFYGMTVGGGELRYGLIFEFDPSTNTYTKKAEFDGSNILNGQSFNGGSNPTGSLTLLKGKFYGMTTAGGSNSAGIIFEWDPLTNNLLKKFDFDLSKGGSPYGSLTNYNGKLYGMTKNGGANNLGVIFEFDPETNTYTDKIDFDGTSKGKNPYGSLTLCNGKLYGMTLYGGTSGVGVIFEWDPEVNSFTKRIDFSYTNGSAPYGSLTLYNGKLYGTTRAGGTTQDGVIFEFDPANNTLTKKIDFNGTSMGDGPDGSLTFAGGAFYGMTHYGGTNGLGVVFKWSPADNSFTKILDFNGINGSSPVYSKFTVYTTQASLVSVSHLNTNQITFNWSDGTGSQRAVFMKQGSDGSPTPENNSTYAASNLFGSGSQIGSSGWYCVFNGDKHTSGVTVTNLQPNTAYRIMVCEYDGVNGSEYYQAFNADGNPLNLTTRVCTPPPPVSISGSSWSCAGRSLIYSVPAVEGAASYTWTLPAGWTGNSSTNEISVVSGANGGTITVAANNTCGSGLSKTMNVTIGKPAQPGSITGSTTVCENSWQTYTVVNVSGATTYSWTLPAGWTGSSATNTITTKAGSAGGVISAAATNECGTSDYTTISVSVNKLPLQPGPISGSSTVNQSSTQTYTVPAASGVTYTWTFPWGWSQMSGGNTSSVTVKVGTGSGEITVTPSGNSCSGPSRALKITVNLSEIPFDNMLYSLTSGGGTDNVGTIFHIDRIEGTHKVDYSFFLNKGKNPDADLTDIGNGKLYGTTPAIDNYELGVIFEWDPNTNIYTKKISFDGTNGSNPRGIMTLMNGKLYGTTSVGGANNCGVLYEWDPITNDLSKKIDFSYLTGAYPNGSLVEFNGKLYGSTYSGGVNNTGVIFEWDPSTNNYIKKRDFEDFAKGAYPLSSLVLKDGKFYGLTSPDIDDEPCGVLFEWDPVTNIYSKKADMDPTTGMYSKGPMTLVGSIFYGTTIFGGEYGRGTIFEFDPEANMVTKKFDFNGTDQGSYATSSLKLLNGKLYGVTSGGGNYGNGTIFEWDIISGTFSKKVDIIEEDSGYNPMGLVLSSGNFYGITYYGGKNDNGVIFRWDPNSNIYQKMMDFEKNNEGFLPQGSMTLFRGKFYGMSLKDESDQGVIFEFDPVSGIYTKKISFSDSGGTSPLGSLTLRGGKFYGMTKNGGTVGGGIIFDWNPADNTFTKRFEFAAGLGSYPIGSLSLYDGKFYGMTSSGGVNNVGVIFEWEPETGSYTKKMDFDGYQKGSTPYGSLALLNGKFYGVTFNGGVNGMGVLFEWDPDLNTFSKKIDFNGINGGFSYGSLCVFNGKLYGLSKSGGTLSNGLIYEWDPATNLITDKIDFDGSSKGGTPYGTLTQSGNKLYGMTYAGGNNNLGVIFEWDPTTNIYRKITDFNGSNGSSPVYSQFAAFTSQASSIVFSEIKTDQIKLDWTDGTGSRRVVFVKQGATGSPVPVDYITYNASTTFGSGSQISNSGWYCVFNGTEPTQGIIIKNLLPNTLYRFMACEVEGGPGSENYDISQAGGNPANQSTLANVSTSMITMKESDDFTVYPNPTTGVLKISSKATQGGEYRIDISSLSGSKVYSKDIVQLQEMNYIDISSLPTGMYLLSIRSSKNIFRTKIIKQ